MEYVPGGNVSSMLKQFGAFSEDIVKRFSRQICIGLEYLHEKGIIHRDIKGANVLLNETGISKLSDFGCSKQLQGMRTTSIDHSINNIRGSVPWMAPEVIRQSGYGRKADIWSLGCTVLEMSTGYRPWPQFENNFSAMFHIATSKSSPVPVDCTLTDVCKDFLLRCFAVEPIVS
jgi:serine/threonine protein kinase